MSEWPVEVVKNGFMYDGLTSVINAARTNGRPMRMKAEARPIDVSARTFRVCRWRSRTVSDNVSKRLASDPPACDCTLIASQRSPSRSIRCARTLHRPLRRADARTALPAEPGRTPRRPVGYRRRRRRASRCEGRVPLEDSTRPSQARPGAGGQRPSSPRRSDLKSNERQCQADHEQDDRCERADARQRPEDLERKGRAQCEVGDVSDPELPTRALDRANEPIRSWEIGQRSLCPNSQRLEPPRDCFYVPVLPRVDVGLQEPDERGLLASPNERGAGGCEQDGAEQYKHRRRGPGVGQTRRERARPGGAGGGHALVGRRR